MLTSWLAGGGCSHLGSPEGPWDGAMGVVRKVEPRRPFGGVFNRTGSLEGPPFAQPGRYPSHGSHEPGTRIWEAAE